jgi:hypothetical protein
MPRRLPVRSRAGLRLFVALTLLIPASSLAKGPSAARVTSGASTAFARYIAIIQEPNPFTQAGPVAIEIEASLPSLYKESRLLALRKLGESEHSRYLLLQVEGDATVVQEVIAPYLAVQDRIEDLPISSVAITPANYRFHYVGEVGKGASSAYVFRITPKKKRDGLIQGELWIDAMTGISTLQAGRLVKLHSSDASYIQVVRDTRLLNGVPFARVTHVTIKTRRVGRGELNITESRLDAVEEGPASPRIRPGDSPERQIAVAPIVAPGRLRPYSKEIADLPPRMIPGSAAGSLTR